MIENKYKGLIRCAECNYTYKGRVERNNINYRCNNRLKNGKDKCSNDTRVEETFLDDMIKQQLYCINREDIIDYREIVEKILVSQTRIEVFYKNLPIKSSYFDSKLGKLHFDSKIV